MDADPWNNIILTQTERLTMSSRPANPKNARNKNVLVIGGSGSGKNTLFHQAEHHAVYQNEGVLSCDY